MTIKKTLAGIVLAEALALSGCGDKEASKPIEKIDGIVKKESFYKGNPSAWRDAYVPNEYHMVVEGSDGHTRLYIFKGDNISKEYDTMYDVGSKVNLPKEGDNVRLIE